MTSKVGHTARALRPRKGDFIKPGSLTFNQWLSHLESERADILRQIRGEVPAGSFAHSNYYERLDRAIIFARAAVAKGLA